MKNKENNFSDVLNCYKETNCHANSYSKTNASNENDVKTEEKN